MQFNTILLISSILFEYTFAVGMGKSCFSNNCLEALNEFDFYEKFESSGVHISQSATQDVLTHVIVSSNVFRDILICSCPWEMFKFIHVFIQEALTTLYVK